MTTDMALTALSQGLMWSIMAIGMFVTFRILSFADLTAEGSFTLGAAVAATLIFRGINPFLATAVAIFAGVCAGLTTGFLHTKFKIPPLLSGILTMTALFSINLRIMSNRANINIFREQTILTFITEHGFSRRTAAIIVGFVCVSIVILFLWWFFNTEIGYAVRATGDNENMIKALGVNSNAMKVLGLAISNSLIAFSGAIVVQFTNSADINMGVGTIVIGLASVIIGEVIFSNKNSHRVFIAVVLGSIIYRMIMAFVILSPFVGAADLRLVAAILIAFILALPIWREKVMSLIKVVMNKGGAS